mmetsp:Transcript_91870/g.262776  ORF Transcript_91870/g.262776 Transcript_91870/m.262776 type:complete len:294 (+) Transcript_91870:404-1285(+)
MGRAELCTLLAQRDIRDSVGQRWRHAYDDHQRLERVLATQPDADRREPSSGASRPRLRAAGQRRGGGGHLHATGRRAGPGDRYGAGLRLAVEGLRRREIGGEVVSGGRERAARPHRRRRHGWRWRRTGGVGRSPVGGSGGGRDVDAHNRHPSSWRRRRRWGCRRFASGGERDGERSGRRGGRWRHAGSDSRSGRVTARRWLWRWPQCPWKSWFQRRRLLRVGDQLDPDRARQPRAANGGPRRGCGPSCVSGLNRATAVGRRLPLSRHGRVGGLRERASAGDCTGRRGGVRARP